MAKPKDNMLTRTAVSRRQDWTLTLVEQLLGEPDERRKVSGFSIPLCLYRLDRVVAAEKSEAFAQDIERRRARKESARKAVETKLTDLLNRIASMQIRVALLDQSELQKKAIASYNRRQEERSEWSWRGNFDYDPARPDSESAFLQRITVNYIRHNLTKYDPAIDSMVGKVGKEPGVDALREKVYAAIATMYPHLAVECARQFSKTAESPCLSYGDDRLWYNFELRGRTVAGKCSAKPRQNAR